MSNHKRLFVGVCLLVWTTSVLAASLDLGSASRTRTVGKHVYLIPISASIDGYSTFRAILTSTDTDFLARTTSEIIKTDAGATLRVFTPQHLDDVVLGVRINYQGRSANKTYRLKADNIDPAPGSSATSTPSRQGPSTNKTYSLKADDIDPAQGSSATIPPYYGCDLQWILRGTLVSNIKRILKACGYVLGGWPKKDVANYVDFVVLEAEALPAPGGLSELLDFVRMRFGFAARISKQSRAVGFIDLTTIKVRNN